MRKSKNKNFQKNFKNQKIKNQNFLKYPSCVSIHNQNLLYTFSDLINKIY